MKDGQIQNALLTSRKLDDSDEFSPPIDNNEMHDKL